MNAIPEAISRASFSSPMGNLVGLASEQGLVALEFEDPGLLGSLESRFHRTFLGMKVESRDTAVHRATGAWLESYFAGGRPDSESVPLDLRGTDFERAVWGALLEVQIGTTVSYSELARRLGRPNGARAIGSSVGRNPIAILVPCHRVIGANGSLTGYAGGLDRKRWLLRHEGTLLV